MDPETKTCIMGIVAMVFGLGLGTVIGWIMYRDWR